jgi:hypothetical protein
MLHVVSILSVLMVFHTSKFEVGSGDEQTSVARGLLLWSAPSGATTYFCLTSFPRASVRCLGRRCNIVEGARHHKVLIWNKTIATRRQAMHRAKTGRREDTEECVLQLPPRFFHASFRRLLERATVAFCPHNLFSGCATGSVGDNLRS